KKTRAARTASPTASASWVALSGRAAGRDSAGPPALKVLIGGPAGPTASPWRILATRRAAARVGELRPRKLRIGIAQPVRMPLPHGLPADPRRAAAQPAQHLLRHPPQPPGCRDGSLRFGQVVPRV